VTGDITDITIALHDTNGVAIESMQNWINSAYFAFAGARREMNFWRMHFGNPATPGSRSGRYAKYESYTYAKGGIEVIYNVVIDGNQMSNFEGWFNSIDRSSVIEVYFTMRII
jgi:hypothetical protein